MSKRTEIASSVLQSGAMTLLAVLLSVASMGFVSVLAIRQTHEAEKQLRFQQDVQCGFFRSVAEVPVPQTASPLGVKIFTEARNASDRLQCSKA